MSPLQQDPDVEEVSAYELRLHDEISFQLSDVVLPLDNTVRGKETQGAAAGCSIRSCRSSVASARVVPLYSLGNSCSGCFFLYLADVTDPDYMLTCVGRVVSIHTDGRIGVHWMSGRKSCMSPFALYKVCACALACAPSRPTCADFTLGSIPVSRLPRTWHYVRRMGIRRALCNATHPRCQTLAPGGCRGRGLPFGARPQRRGVGDGRRSSGVCVCYTWPDLLLAEMPVPACCAAATASQPAFVTFSHAFARRSSR